jgi:hypothetical protein
MFLTIDELMSLEVEPPTEQVFNSSPPLGISHFQPLVCEVCEVRAKNY